MGQTDQNILEQFLEMMLFERQSSKLTVEAYNHDLQTHISYLQQIGKNLQTATYQDLLGWNQDLSLRGVGDSTIARKNSVLKQIYKFMLLEELRADNPSKLLAVGKIKKTLPKILTQDEVTRLFDAIALFKNHNERVRLMCLLEILYGCGLRVSELVSLPTSAIIINSGVVRVSGKGNKERVIPLSKMALQALQEYFKVRNYFAQKTLQSQKDKNYLFPSKGSQGHLTRQAFGQILKQLALYANIAPEKISPHSLRHAFASHMLSNGAGLLNVQKMLGHADIATTQIYTHILDDKVKKFVLEQHPLNELLE